MAAAPIVTISDGSVGTINADGSVTVKPRFTSIGGGQPNCPYGTTWNADLEMCVEDPGVFNFCPQGMFWDDITQQCVSSIPNIPRIPDTTSTTSQGNVSVTVNNAVNITDQTLSQVADAVKAGIQNGAAQASNIAEDTTNAITGALSKVVDGIGAGIQSALSSIWDSIKSIASFVYNNLQPIISAIGDNIGKAVGVIATALKDAIGPIADTISSVANTVKSINDGLIQPLTQAVTGVITTISSLTVAIERDLHAGLSGILQIPSDIASSMAGLDATMQRTVQQLGLDNKDTITTTWKPAIESTLGTRLESIGAAIGKPTVKPIDGTTFHDLVKLQDENLLQIAKQFADIFLSNSGVIVGNIAPQMQELMNAFKKARGADDGMFGVLVDAGIWVAVVLAAISGTLKPLVSGVLDISNAAMPLSKLGIDTAVKAWMRGFIDDKQLRQELKYEGLDDTRIDVMIDLSRQFIGVSEIVDMYWRGISTLQDTRDNLNSHGFTPVDADAIIAASTKLFSVETALTSWKYGLLTDEQLRSIMSQHRYTDAEQDATIANAMSPESMSDVITRLRIQALYSGLKFSDPAFSSVPDELSQAARRDGVSAQVALDVWQRSYWVPQVSEYIQLYFRGKRTLTEVIAVMDYHAVPEQLRADLIDAHRALIPYRTIPTMLKKGIIEEPYAKQQLLAHGFDLTAVEAILKYAELGATTLPGSSSGNTHALSVSNAHQFWDLGVLTDDQYEQVLIAHGYTVQMAKATISAERLADAAKQRKALATDLVNEIVSGLITIDDAQAQMSSHNFTASERAKVINAVARTQRQNNKIPSETDLHHMAEKGVITVDVYASTLSILGYAKQWIDAFVNWRFGGSNAAPTAG